MMRYRIFAALTVLFCIFTMAFAFTGGFQLLHGAGKSQQQRNIMTARRRRTTLNIRLK